MRRPLCTILASFVLATNLLGAQESKPQSSESGAISPGGADATILKILQQSHALDQQLPVWDRATLLSRQAEMVSRLRPDLGRDWANELFTLSPQTKREDQRSFMQNHAMGQRGMHGGFERGARISFSRIDILSEAVRYFRQIEGNENLVQQRVGHPFARSFDP